MELNIIWWRIDNMTASHYEYLISRLVPGIVFTLDEFCFLYIRTIIKTCFHFRVSMTFDPKGMKLTQGKNREVDAMQGVLWCKFDKCFRGYVDYQAFILAFL